LNEEMNGAGKLKRYRQELGLSRNIEQTLGNKFYLILLLSTAGMRTAHTKNIS
jgi:hypothetical protein